MLPPIRTTHAAQGLWNLGGLFHAPLGNMAPIIGALGAIAFAIFWFVRRRRGIAGDELERNARSGDRR
jgi:hypothetical protein